MLCRDPVCIACTIVQLGPRLLLGWVRDFVALALYTLAYSLLAPLRRLPLLRRSWRFRRLLDALCWGSGADFRDRHHAAGAAATVAAAAVAVAPAQ